MLSKNFSLEELIASPTADRLGLKNDPPPDAIENLKALCWNCLQAIRGHYKKPISVNSGYRGPEVNAAVGGNPKGQHPKGEAADIEIAGIDNLKLAQDIAGGKVCEFDQLILEFYVPGEPTSGWVHVSYKKNGPQRGQVLHAVRQKGKVVYKTGLPS